MLLLYGSRIGLAECVNCSQVYIHLPQKLSYAGGMLTFDQFVGLLAEATALTAQFRK